MYDILRHLMPLLLVSHEWPGTVIGSWIAAVSSNVVRNIYVGALGVGMMVVTVVSQLGRPDSSACVSTVSESESATSQCRHENVVLEIADRVRRPVVVIVYSQRLGGQGIKAGQSSNDIERFMVQPRK
jgi:hypothetical protein